jgi:hypothetical protein
MSRGCGGVRTGRGTGWQRWRWRRKSDLRARRRGRSSEEELLNALARLTAKYHNDKEPAGRAFRYLLGAYPVITKQESENEENFRLDSAREGEGDGDAIARDPD